MQLIFCGIRSGIGWMGDKNTRIILYIITIINISHQTNHRLTRQETKFCLNLIYFLEVRNSTGITTRPPQ